MVGFFEGLFKPDRKINAEGTIRHLDKLTDKLAKLGGSEAVEHLETLNKAAKTLKGAEAAHIGAVEGGFATDATKEALREANKAAMDAAKAGRSHLKGVSRFKMGQRFGRVASNKFVAIPVLALGGLAAIAGTASWLGGKRDEKEHDSRLELQNQQTNAMRADITAMQQSAPPAQSNTLMGEEPVVGNYASKVLAARNGTAGGIDVSNPTVNMQFDAVRS